MRGLTRISCVVIFALVLASCATTLESIPAHYAMQPGEESVVIGRVAIDLSGSSIKPIGFFDRLNKILISAKNTTTDKDFEIVCDQGGSDSNFYVALPPGEYRITKVRKAQLESTPPGRFTVGKGQIIYIGSIKFVGRGLGAGIVASLMAGRTSFPGDWLVGDEYLDVVRSFREKYPGLGNEVVKSLME